MPHLPVWAVFSATLLDVLVYGFCVGLSQGCLRIGRGISEVDSKTGYQDAVSPPLLAQSMLALNLIFFGLVGYSLWEFGILIALGEAAGSLVAFGVGAFLLPPKPEAPYYARLTYASLCRREANYAKKNDKIRANVARELAERIYDRFAGDLEASISGYMGIKR
jgi:hypothetical protein